MERVKIADLFLGKVVVSKSHGSRHLINGYGRPNVILSGLIGGISYHTLRYDYTFQDGSPCGVKL